MQITLLVPCFRIPSVNELYLHNRQSGEIFKNPDTVRMIDQMRTFMADRYPLHLFSWLNQSSRVHISYDFILKKSLWRRDVSNMIKCAQDTITRYIGIDDSQVLSIFARKSLSKTNGIEWIACTITDTPDLMIPESNNTIVIPVKYLPSINSMYGYDTKSKQVYKENWVHGVEKQIQTYLKYTVPKHKFKFVQNKVKFRCYYEFFLKTLYEPISQGTTKSRDVDNLIKAIEDAIFRFFGVDDHWVLELVARKHISPSVRSEYVAFTIEVSDYDPSSFNTR